MHYLVGLALLSLFVPLRLRTGVVLLRPFEVLTFLSMIALLTVLRSRQPIRIGTSLVLLLPFVCWSLGSAFTVGFANGVRETLQFSIILTMALILAQVQYIDFEKLGRLLLTGVAIIMIGNIAYHLSRGIWVGWKQFADPRLCFIVFPMLLCCALLFAPAARKRRLWVAWVMLAPILLMSGERKALLTYLFLSALMAIRGRLSLLLPSLLIGFVLLLGLSEVVENPYLARQLGTLTNPFRTGDYDYLISTGEYAPGDTPSNVQRTLAFKLAADMVAQHPLTGVGTNHYRNILESQFYYLPNDIRVDIHGEFQRVLTENGLIGLTLYLLIWLCSYARTKQVLRNLVRNGQITLYQARLLPAVFYVPLVAAVGLEGSGTRSFVALSVISLFPDLLRGALGKLKRPQAPERQGPAAPLTSPVWRLRPPAGKAPPNRPAF